MAVIDSQSIKTKVNGGTCGYDASKRIKGRMRYISVETEGLLIAVHVHTADILDRDSAPAIMLEGAPTVTKPFADGGYWTQYLLEILKFQAISDLIEIVEKPKAIKEFTVHYR